MNIARIFMIFGLQVLLFSACAMNGGKSAPNPPNLSSNPPPKPNLTQIAQIPQKLADFPKDSIIKVLDESGETRCYMPDVRSVYAVIGTCRTSWAKPARYDVFGRIAYNIKDTWLCLTAPESVAQTKRKDKDYLTLKPCVINDKKQQWKVKDDLFYALDEGYVIKDDGAYLYAASARETSLKLSKIHTSMSEWLSTIARPANLSIITSLAWDYTTSEGAQRYFLYNNGSSKNTTDLYYNLGSGHIAQYDGYKGLNCLYADLGGAQWSWAWWDKCTDAPAPSKSANKAYWNFVRTSQNQALLINHQGAALRVGSVGINWGKPYVVSPEYMPKDTSTSPTSQFVIDKDTGDWLRFIYANMGDNLPYCPAPAAQKLALSQNSPLKNPPLPGDFNVSDEWRARLLDIVNTNDHAETSAGVCGVCLLQSFQIIAELLENPQTPRTSGGYFFDTQDGVNPFISFEARNSLLYGTLNDLVNWFPRFVETGTRTPQMAFEHNNNLAMMSAIALLPQYDWSIFAHSQGARDVVNVVDRLLNAPNGSLFVVLLRLRNEADEEGGHAMISLRTPEGVVLVPTNVRMNAEEFVEFTIPVNDRYDFLDSFESFGFTITNIALLSAEAMYANIFATTVSLSDCTGEGEDRRGSGALPTSAFVNQCASGRCLE